MPCCHAAATYIYIFLLLRRFLFLHIIFWEWACLPERTQQLFPSFSLPCHAMSSLRSSSFLSLRIICFYIPFWLNNETCFLPVFLKKFVLIITCITLFSMVIRIFSSFLPPKLLFIHVDTLLLLLLLPWDMRHEPSSSMPRLLVGIFIESSSHVSFLLPSFTYAAIAIWSAFPSMAQHSRRAASTCRFMSRLKRRCH